jgi:ABC-2 type transport system ATP-binding protein
MDKNSQEKKEVKIFRPLETYAIRAYESVGWKLKGSRFKKGIYSTLTFLREKSVINKDDLGEIEKAIEAALKSFEKLYIEKRNVGLIPSLAAGLGGGGAFSCGTALAVNFVSSAVALNLGIGLEIIGAGLCAAAFPIYKYINEKKIAAYDSAIDIALSELEKRQAEAATFLLINNAEAIQAPQARVSAVQTVIRQEPASQYIIEVENLTKDYGSGRGIFDVTLSVQKGETLGFLGPNGAGKTTAIRQLAGFQFPQSGTAKILRMDCFTDRCEIMKNVGYLPGEVNFPQGLKAKDVIKIASAVKGIESGKSREAELLKLFPIDLDARTKKMSVGERRKLAIIVAFLSDPDILILDEPSSGLDPIMQKTFIEFILGEKKKGKTILLSSHMFDEVGALCDRISIIKDGRIIKELTAADIKIPPEKTYEVSFASGEIKTVTVSDDGINEFISSFRGQNVINFVEKKFDLETYFLNFYKSSKTFMEV